MELYKRDLILIPEGEFLGEAVVGEIAEAGGVVAIEAPDDPASG